MTQSEFGARTQPKNGAMTLHFDGSVRRGSFELQAEVSVAAGEVLGVIGPNGAGKTTLLRTLAGLARLETGRIVLAGTVLDDATAEVFVPAEQRPVGLVFQNYRLFPHLSVRDNVAFAHRMRGVPRRRAHAQSQTWLDRLDLTEMADRKPAQLSGGQAQRVALARALASEPRLLLLDEPLAALDAETRLQVRTELSKHLAEFAGPALVITHDPLEAMVLTDRLLVIEAGRVVQSGTPVEVATRPATNYVARLVGLNLYRGVVHGADVLIDGGGALTGLVDPAVTDGTRVQAALSPGAVTVHLHQPADLSARNVWPGVVTGLELLADRVRLQVQAEPPVLVDITPAALAELSLAPGRPVWLSAKAGDVTVYP